MVLRSLSHQGAHVGHPSSRYRRRRPSRGWNVVAFRQFLGPLDCLKLVSEIGAPECLLPVGLTGERSLSSHAFLVYDKMHMLFHKKSCFKNWARGLCVSTQHMEGTIGYQFELSTLLVLDEVGSGIPIAYFICNKMNEEYLAAFFRSLEFAISKKVEAKRLMPDDASQFYKAWPPVMGAPQQKLLCAWHVDRNWQKKIHECLEKQLRPDVYHNLRLLLEFLDQQEFEEYLLSFLDIQETKLRDFLKYFKDSYAVIPQEWAYCFRTRAGINTNMRLESIHRTLKHSMSEGRKNKRVDKLISALMNFT
ncbi:hypothetical protein HPB51_000378 [Rhipicephalus microplus]|uniref:MULE transposase domain-containing protein n=1 Tax=Rhipicephalus microplus TaxID=6941 RepID=A0A9J6DYK5_RHIMP|nr:hypothetical protein HPB51_000378 [Rhipicephalus microplus]